MIHGNKIRCGETIGLIGNLYRDVQSDLGFSDKWTNWIMEYTTTTSMSVLVYGILKESFKPKRRIRQRDPISPYIFIYLYEVSW